MAESGQDAFESTLDPIAKTPGYEGDDPFGDPYDRKWPGKCGTSVKPYKYGWYELTPEQRFMMTFNSWILINGAISSPEIISFSAEITDDMLMVLAWGANDTEALEAGRKVLEDAGLPEGLYDEVVG